MKQLLTFLALIFSYMLCGAQATTLVVDNQTPGWLSSKINYGDQQTIENLTVTGYVNNTDLTFIGSLMKKQKLNGHLDLTNVEIVDTEYKDNPTQPIGKLHMFDLSGSVSIRRFSIPKSLPNISSYLLGYVSADTLDYGSTKCEILKQFNHRNASYATNPTPKVLILRDGVKKIGSNIMMDVDGLKLLQVILPQTIDSIGDRAFYDCRNLSKINLPNSIHTIGEYAFKDTAILPDTLRLPESLKVFHINSFPVQNGQTVYIGNQVEKIDNHDSKLKRESKLTYYINRITPPIFTTQYYPDAVDLKGCTLYVPKEGYSMYSSPTYPPGSTGQNPYSFATVKAIPVPVNEVSINHSSLSLNVGNIINLIADVQPNNADNKTIIWSSSNPNVANVNNYGSVTALSCGTTIIKASSKENANIFAICEITVHQPLQSISIKPTTITLNAGETYENLQLTFYPANADNKAVTWQSSDESIATVDNNGTVKAISGGEAKITVTSVENPEIKDVCTVTVIQPVTDIALNKSALELTEDESEQLIATVLPENATNKSVNWTSSDISVAMVSPDGTVYAVKPGQATIMATSEDGGFVALCKVTVKAKIIIAESLALSITNADMTAGETMQLNATVLPENTTNKNIRWTSTNSNIATVTETGLVSAHKEGNAQIIASTTDGTNLSAICEISVNKSFVPVTLISIAPSSVKLAVGESLKLDAQIEPADATNKSINWSSTNSSVASVNTAGQLTANGEGNAIIIASTQDGTNISATCSVTVDVNSGINDILNDSDTYVRIYTLQGILIFEGEYAKSNLKTGAYIFNIGNQYFKHLIK